MGTEYKGQRFSGPVEVDGGTFVDCVFDQATLVYRGGARPVISRCTFQSTGFVFRGAAAATLGMLAHMAKPESGLRSAVAKTFYEILNEAGQDAPREADYG